MATFENPNSPVQPQPGVYAWYVQRTGYEIAIYVGNAGARNSCLRKGTLYRGASELQRSIFTSNSARDELDTDFVVGTAVLYFEEKRGWPCVWRHISDDPNEEIKYVRDLKPVLQNESNAAIRRDYKVKKGVKDYWYQRRTKEGVEEAEREVFSVLDKAISNDPRFH